jgi:hypothetical protein
MSVWFANLVISMAQAGLAAGTAANLRKGASKGASAAGLFFLLLGLSFFIVLDYYSRFSPVTDTVKTGLLFVFGSLFLTICGFVPYVTMSQKGDAKAKSAAPGTAMAIYLTVSGIMGLILGKMGGELNAQSVILTNMYIILGSILGFNAQAAKSDQSARSNVVMATLGLVLLALFDTLGTAATDAKTAAAKAAAETAEATAKAAAAEAAANAAEAARTEAAKTEAKAASNAAAEAARTAPRGSRETAGAKAVEAASKAVEAAEAARVAADKAAASETAAKAARVDADAKAAEAARVAAKPAAKAAVTQSPAQSTAEDPAQSTAAA